MVKAMTRVVLNQGSFEMCYELCGPPIDGTPEDMADYDAWLNDEGPYAPEVEEEEESKTISERDALERFDDFLNEC